MAIALVLLLSSISFVSSKGYRVTAMRLSVSYGAHIVIPPIFGAVGAAMGVAPIFWSCALLLGGGSAITRPHNRK